MYASTLRFSQSFFSNQVLFTLFLCTVLHLFRVFSPKADKNEITAQNEKYSTAVLFCYIVLDRLCQIKTHSPEQKILNVYMYYRPIKNLAVPLRAIQFLDGLICKNLAYVFGYFLNVQSQSFQCKNPSRNCSVLNESARP